jgi:hypothetical protein
MTPEQLDTTPEPHVFTDENPEYPSMVYNHETRQTKAATSKEHKEELAQQGFVDEPFGPLDPDELTEAEAEELQKLLVKAAKALAKLGRLQPKAYERENEAYYQK